MKPAATIVESNGFAMMQAVVTLIGCLREAYEAHPIQSL